MFQNDIYSKNVGNILYDQPLRRFYYPKNNIALTTKTKGMFYSFQQKMQKK